MVLDFLNSSLSGAEGDTVEVCIVITEFPSGGVEIPVTLEIGVRNGPKAGESIYWYTSHDLFTCHVIHSQCLERTLTLWDHRV